MSLGHIGESLLPLTRLTEGWNTLCQKTHNALTHFHHDDEPETATPDSQRWALVATDLTDHADHLELRMELPGVAKPDLKVEVGANQIVISGHKKSESTRREGQAVITERAFGSFRRVLPLPEDVDAAAVQARYEDGVLAVDLPKTGGHSRKSISVQ